MKQLSITAGEIVSGEITLLGSGALACVAFYGGVTMFSSASGIEIMHTIKKEV